jgi:serine/threonine-protein kinase 11
MLVGSPPLWKFTSVTHPVSAHPLRQINNYLLKLKIGSGTSGQVYLGIDQKSVRSYAIKRIKLSDLIRSSSGLAQLEREIRLMRLLTHPNILALLEVLHLKNRDEVLLVLDYAEKGSVGDFVDRGQELSVASILSILKQVIGALQYLHGQGYVHHDVKPHNILIDVNGRAMLADFGIGHSFASTCMVVGSPAYQAPEVLDDAYGREEDSDVFLDEPQKEDVWALGVTFYQLLFKNLPFVGSTLFEIVKEIRDRPLEIPEGTDEAIIELLRGMLAVDPIARLSIEDLIRNPLIRDAADRATELPDVPPLRFREGPVVELHAEVCGVGYSFADVGLAVPRRFSCDTPHTGEKAAARRGVASDEEAVVHGRSAKIERTPLVSDFL